MRIVHQTLLALFAVGLSTVAGLPTAAGKTAGPNPAAPPETSQYSFLIGKWHCKTRSMRPDQTFAEGFATWTGEYILDGWAIQDTWVSTLPQGGEFYGTNIRSYNSEAQKWDNRWLPQGSLEWKQFDSTNIGDTMVMTGGIGTDGRGEFTDRNTFHDITSTSWKWRKDRSYDGGENWIIGVSLIEATLAVSDSVLDSVEHGFVDNAGVKIHYAAMGTGPLVILLHGFPDYWYTWRHQMAALADTHRVVAIDLRGYNQSDQPEGVAAYAMRNLIGDVAAVVRQFGEEPATIIGHDWGGAIAWYVAAYQPDLVDRLVILSTPHPTALKRELAHNTEQQANSDYARRFQAEGSHESLTAEGLAEWVDDPAARVHYIEAFRRSSFEAMMAYYKANYPPSDGSTSTSPPAIPATIPNVRAPVLAIHGLDDSALLPEGFNSTWEFVDGELTVVSLPDVGHWPQHEATEAVNRALLNWLSAKKGE